MITTFRLLRVLTLVGVAGMIAVACDDPPAPEPEPEVATLRLIIGGNDTVLVNTANGNVVSGPITIAANTNFTAQFLKADSTPETIVTAADFRLDATPVNAAIVTFTRTGAFAGTLNKVTAGSTSINFALFHLEEQHNEFDHPVSITVN